MKYLEVLQQLGGLMLLAWYICSLKPLQLVADHFAQKSGLFNNFIYPLVSCRWCTTLWVVAAGLKFGWVLPWWLAVALLCSFVVRIVILLDERERVNAG